MQYPGTTPEPLRLGAGALGGAFVFGVAIGFGSRG